MLFHLILDYLPVALLDALEVLLSLLELVFAVEYQGFDRVDFLTDSTHDLGYNLNL